MDKKIDEICTNSMQRILEDRPNENDTRSKLIVFVVEYVKEKLYYYSEEYKYTVSTFLLGPIVKWWITQKSCANPQFDFSQKTTYDSEEWTAYTIVFNHKIGQLYYQQSNLKHIKMS